MQHLREGILSIGRHEKAFETSYKSKGAFTEHTRAFRSRGQSTTHMRRAHAGENSYQHLRDWTFNRSCTWFKFGRIIFEVVTLCNNGLCNAPATLGILPGSTVFLSTPWYSYCQTAEHPLRASASKNDLMLFLKLEKDKILHQRISPKMPLYLGPFSIFILKRSSLSRKIRQARQWLVEPALSTLERNDKSRMY